MRCPSCGNEVPARPTCLQCGASLFGQATLPASAQGPLRLPLTFGQRARLLAGCLPVFVLAAMVAAYWLLASRETVPGPVPWFWLLMGGVFLALAYQAFQRLRDLASGVVLVEEDLLNRSWAGRSQGRGTYYGRFERLGTLRLVPKAHFQTSPGQRYRVVYSPASKIVWALEPPDERFRW